MNISKEKNFSEWFTQIIKDAELADIRYNVKGFVVFRPWSVVTMKKMYQFYEQELELHDHLPTYFPALIPESNFKSESEHVEGFVPQVFWVTHAGEEKLEERLALRPTSETAMYPMYALWVQGLKDLPLKIYQSCQVWRHETKATRPFIRSREFYWIEAHDAFATEAEAFAQVREDMEMAEEVLHRQFGIPFLFFQRPEWDKFPGAVHTYAADSLMPDNRIIQLPSTHLLGQNFAKAFGLKFLNEKGEYDFAWQTCYGPAISRIYASLISMHGDDRGLVLPFSLAPLQVVVVPILQKGKEEDVTKYCQQLEKQLKAQGLRAKADLSQNTAGYKFNEWEMKGVPVRLEVGPREMTEQAVTAVRRDTAKKEKIPVADLSAYLASAEKGILASLRAKADAWFSQRLQQAASLSELKQKAEAGGFVRVPFCTLEKEGAACADQLKAELAVNVRGSLFTEKEKPQGEKCVACGQPASVYVYVGKQY